MKKNSPLVLATALVAAAVASGCATSVANLQGSLQRDTALALGLQGRVSPTEIAISDIETGTACYTSCPGHWRATLPDGTRYDCTSPPPDAVADQKPVCTRHP